MANEPVIKRTVAFFDGQNLFHAAKEAYGYTYPNYDPYQLANGVCKDQGWALSQVRFYTGVPDRSDDYFWNQFWISKLAEMGRKGISVYSRSLRYRNQRVELPDGTIHTFLVGSEKGIDVRIALDVIRLALQQVYDVALIFSQDQDLSEVSEEIRRIATTQGRWIKIASAFPVSPTKKYKRGIDQTDWISIERNMYDKCIDPKNYRPKQK